MASEGQNLTRCLDPQDLGTSGQPNKLETFLDIARDRQNTVAEQEAQRRSFAYGNTHFENETITRDVVDKAAEDLQAKDATDRHTTR